MEPTGKIRVAVVGAVGRMGREVVRAMTTDDDFEVLIAVDRNGIGSKCTEWVPDGPEVEIEAKLGAALDRCPVDVLVDFSNHTAAPAHAISAMKRGVAPVIGCTGMSERELKEIAQASEEFKVPAMYVPNFAIGAVLMMHFAELAAKWLPNVEIIEMHHDRKEDAPSGTAILTAHKIHDARTQPPQRPLDGHMKVEGARGGRYLETQIHSVRLPGLLAHQQVLFGGPGELLTIRHDSLDRSSFMEGVKICARHVRSLSGLTIGMDSVLFA